MQYKFNPQPEQGENMDNENIHIRNMKYEDIILICKSDNDESEANRNYLQNQLTNQEKIQNGQ